MAGSNVNTANVPSHLSTSSAICGYSVPTKSNITSQALSLSQLYAQRFFRDLSTIKRAHPDLTVEQCRYILERKLAGILNKVVSRAAEPDLIPRSSGPGNALDDLPDGNEGYLSSQPLIRTESCPLPRRVVLDVVQSMKRQRSVWQLNLHTSLSLIAVTDASSILGPPSVEDRSKCYILRTPPLERRAFFIQ